MLIRPSYPSEQQSVASRTDAPTKNQLLFTGIEASGAMILAFYWKGLEPSLFLNKYSLLLAAKSFMLP
jgi:hypothetical protein